MNSNLKTSASPIFRLKCWFQRQGGVNLIKMDRNKKSDFGICDLGRNTV